MAILTLTFLLAGEAVPVPQLLAGISKPVQFELLLASAYASLTAHCFGGESLRMEASARRSLLLADFTLFGTLLAPVALAMAVGAVTRDTGFVLAVMRDFTAFVAFALLVVTFGGQTAAAAVPVVYLLVIGTVGVGADGSSPWWAALRRTPTMSSALVTTLLAVAGVGVFHLWARRRPNLA